MIFEPFTPDPSTPVPRTSFWDLTPFVVYDADGVCHDFVVSFDPETGEITKLDQDDLSIEMLGIYPAPLVVAPCCNIEPDPITGVRNQGDMASPCVEYLKRSGCQMIEVI